MKKQDQRIQLVASTDFRNDVDKWRREQNDLPSHSEAIRRLVKIALRSKENEMMKMIVAIIRPHKYEEVRNALIDIGIDGLSATEIRGFGRQRGQTEIYRGAEYNVSFVPKLKIEIAVPDEMEIAVHEALIQNASTGQIGDGKIFVLDLHSATRIRTGETEDNAL